MYFFNNSRYLFFIHDATVLNFAGQSFNMPANSIKISLLIANWAFASVQNSLQINFKNFSQAAVSNCDVQSHADGRDNLRWYQLKINDYSLYAQLEEVILVIH